MIMVPPEAKLKNLPPHDKSDKASSVVDTVIFSMAYVFPVLLGYDNLNHDKRGNCSDRKACLVQNV